MSQYKEGCLYRKEVRSGIKVIKPTNPKAVKSKKLDWLVVYVDYDILHLFNNGEYDSQIKPTRFRVLGEYKNEETARRSMVNRRWFDLYMVHRDLFEKVYKHVRF
jgi:hypothetical protein